ncbi:MAG: hypothetical protein M3P51_03030 [Chloroflexota bacterium]|nr:hypothetical protein [Chloroflexota bacterium]
MAEYDHVPGSEHLERARLSEPDLLLRHGYDARARRNPDDVTLVHQGEWLRAWHTSARVASLELGREPASSLAYPVHPANSDEPELISLLVDRGYAVRVWEYGSEWSRFGVRKGEVAPRQSVPRLTVSDRLTREEAEHKEGKGRMQTQQPSMDEEVRLVRGRLEGRPRHKLEHLVVKLGLMVEGEAKGAEKGVLVDRLVEAVRERRVPPEVLQAFLAASSVSSPEVLRSATVDKLSPTPGCAYDVAPETGDVRHEEQAEPGGTEEPPSEAAGAEGCPLSSGEEERLPEESAGDRGAGVQATCPPARSGLAGHIASPQTGGLQSAPDRDAKLVVTLTHQGGDSYQASILYGGPGRDPFYRVYEVSSIQEAIDEVPAVIADAEEQWSESPRYPKADSLKPTKGTQKPKTEPKPESRASQATRPAWSPSAQQASQPQQVQLDLFGG